MELLCSVRGRVLQVVNTRITMFPFQQYVNTSHKHTEIIVFNWTFVAVTLYLQFTFTDTRKKKNVPCTDTRRSVVLQTAPWVLSVCQISQLESLFFFPCCDHRPERSCVIAAEAYLLPLTRLSRCHSQLYNQARNNQAEELYP